MSTIASQINSLTIVYSTVYSDADQRKNESSTSLAFVWGIHRWPVNSPHKGPVTRKMFPFEDVIMSLCGNDSDIIGQMPFPKMANQILFQIIVTHKSSYCFLAATKQLYKWYFPSVCLSVRLSVTPFSPCSHHRIIMKFSGVITMVKSDVYAKGQGQRSKVKVTEVNTQLSRFRTLTPV